MFLHQICVLDNPIVDGLVGNVKLTVDGMSGEMSVDGEDFLGLFNVLLLESVLVPRRIPLAVDCGSISVEGLLSRIAF